MVLVDAAVSAAIGAAVIAALNEVRARSHARAARIDREERERELAGRPTGGTRRGDARTKRERRTLIRGRPWP